MPTGRHTELATGMVLSQPKPGTELISGGQGCTTTYACSGHTHRRVRLSPIILAAPSVLSLVRKLAVRETHGEVGELGNLSELSFGAAADTALWVMVPPTKSEDLSLIPGPTWWESEQPRTKSFNLRMLGMGCVLPRV